MEVPEGMSPGISLGMHPESSDGIYPEIFSIGNFK